MKQLRITEVKGRMPLPAKEAKEAVRFIRKYHEEIIEKWATFFVKNKKVTCEKITQKIK